MAIYVCSDIHGRKDRYDKIFNYVTEKDKLYILGDCIDRHPDGIAIIQDIMKRDNVHLLLGNHEHMMLSYKEDKSMQDVWLYPNNGGEVTLGRFLELPEEERNNIINYLKNCSVYKAISVNDQKYILAHGFPPCNPEKDEEVMEGITEQDVMHILWNSPLELWYGSSHLSDEEKYIVGHVYVQRLHNSFKMYVKNNIIDIDGGCALPDEYNSMTNLILLRLDDMEEIYIN